MPNISLNWTFAPRFSPLSSKVFTSLSYLSVVLSVADRNLLIFMLINTSQLDISELIAIRSEKVSCSNQVHVFHHG